tara:strand:+ start:1765 stop:2412 length:648 start_codon:yes stop_codon:yes gene_type:complete
MADIKISQLPLAAALTGTEVLPVVQSGATVQTSVNSVLSSVQPTLVSGTNIKTVSGASLLGSGDVGSIGVAYGGTGQTTYTDGQLLIGNTTGNTLTKAALTPGPGISIVNGSGSITISNTASAFLPLNVVTGTSQAAAVGNHYVLTNVAATTVTLPATPAVGDIVWVTVGNGLITNVVARNGNNIQSIAENLTLNAKYAAVQMRYINSTIGWTFV